MTKINLKPKPKRLEPTHYMRLGVPPASSYDELHAAYKRLAQQHHTNGDFSEGMREINFAWGVLKNVDARKKYDAFLYLLNEQCETCKGTGVEMVTISFVKKRRELCKICKGAGQKKGGS